MRIFLRYRAIKDIAQITSYRDAIGAPCIRAQKIFVYLAIVYNVLFSELWSVHCIKKERVSFTNASVVAKRTSPPGSTTWIRTVMGY